MWILTITFSSPDDNELSPVHRHSLAMGKSDFDHTAVLDWYKNEMKEFAAGGDVFCGATTSFKRITMGLIAYLSVRPEHYLLPKYNLLGPF